MCREVQFSSPNGRNNLIETPVTSLARTDGLDKFFSFFSGTIFISFTARVTLLRRCIRNYVYFEESFLSPNLLVADAKIIDF
jgi:hypothetical protein